MARIQKKFVEGIGLDPFHAGTSPEVLRDMEDDEVEIVDEVIGLDHNFTREIKVVEVLLK